MLPALVACAVKPQPIALEFNPPDLDFPSLSYRDEVPEAVEVGIHNAGTGPVWLSFPGFEGEGSEALTAVEPPEEELVLDRETYTIRVGVRQVKTDWTDGSVSVGFLVEADSAVNGQMGSPYDHHGQPETWTLPITLAIACDLDFDGHEADACGGGDCSDEDAEVNPDVPEDCENGKDDDCDGTMGC
jgi:hypothetical protein